MRMNEIEKGRDGDEEENYLGCGGRRRRTLNQALRREDTETLLFALCFSLIYLLLFLRVLLFTQMFLLFPKVNVQNAHT